MRSIKAGLCVVSLMAAVVACSDGDSTSGSKGVVDEEALDADGVRVTLAGNVGTVEVPFIAPVPRKPSDEDLNEALESAASLTVRSDVTGTTANLSDGSWVEGTPSAPGQFNWELNDERDMLTFRFYNETVAGTTLKNDRTYTGQMQIATNPYVANVASTAVAIAVD